MRKILTVSLCLLTLACVSKRDRSAEEQDSLSKKLRDLKTEGPRKRVLVLPIINESAEKDPNVVKVSRESLLKGLKLTDSFVILDNGDLPKDVSSFKKDGGYDMDSLMKLGQEMGVVAILDGRVLEVKVRKVGEEVGLLRTVRADVTVTVGMRVYSPLARKEVFNEVRSAQSSEKNYRVMDPDQKRSLVSDPLLIQEALYNAFGGFIPPITKSIEKLGWTGRVAFVRGEKIYLNAGRITGLNVGDILKVYDVGDDIYDPETGLFIGKAPGRVKGTLEIVSYFGKDGCVTIVHSGSGFKENDRVELY